MATTTKPSNTTRKKSQATFWSITKRVVSDVFTTSANDFDPARLFGYGFAVLASLVFLILSIYDVVANRQHFNMNEFAMSALAMGGMYTAIAAGVRVKADTEPPYVEPNPNPVSSPNGNRPS